MGMPGSCPVLMIRPKILGVMNMGMPGSCAVLMIRSKILGVMNMGMPGSCAVFVRMCATRSWKELLRRVFFKKLF